jgi:transposase-like protein
MANKKNFTLSEAERRRRTFSTEFKQKKVREIEQKITRIADVCKEYEVSEINVRKWMQKFSSSGIKGVRTIVEAESDTRKLLEAKAKIAELERAVGQKQIMLDFKDKMIDLAEETYGVDIKKKFGTAPSSGTGKTEKS